MLGPSKRVENATIDILYQLMCSFSMIHPGFETENRVLPKIFIVLNNFYLNPDQDDNENSLSNNQFNVYIDAIRKQLAHRILNTMYY